MMGAPFYLKQYLKPSFIIYMSYYPLLGMIDQDTLTT